MAKKKIENNDESLNLAGNEAELEQAIDGLRGVLKQDADGDAPAFGGDFGGDSFGGETTADSGTLPAFGGDSFGSSDFGDDDLGSTAFGESPL